MMFVCFVLFFLVSVNQADLVPDEPFSEEDLYRTFDALDRILDFYGKNLKDFTYDVEIGVRSVEGAMKRIRLMLLDALNDSVKRNTAGFSKALERSRELQMKAGQVGNLGLEAVRKNYSHLHRALYTTMLPKMFETWFDIRYLEPVDTCTTKHSTDKSPYLSMFTCLAEFLPPFNGTRVKKCTISDHCWDLMTNSNSHGYDTTHQVIYLAAILMQNCSSAAEKLMKPLGQKSIPEILHCLCYQIYQDAKVIEKLGYPEELQDIFMEQVGMCSYGGFRDFANKKWLSKVLSWQKAPGCYNNTIVSTGELLDTLVTSIENSEKGADLNKILGNLVRLILVTVEQDTVTDSRETYIDDLFNMKPRLMVNFFEEFAGHKRYKRLERRMTYNCLSHKTSVAAFALAGTSYFIAQETLMQST